MMIFGIGIDVVEVERVESSIAEFGERFVSREFTEAERAYCESQKRPAIHYAARFAAKEAVAKALGTGFRNRLNFKDIQVSNNKLGKPYYVISSKLKNIIKKKRKIKNFNLFLSISDEKDYSTAFTIIESI